MVADWRDIEQQLGVPGLEAFCRDEIAPAFAALGDGGPALKRANPVPYFFGGFIAFVISFMGLETLMPDTGLGGVLTFIAFPFLFFGCLGAGLWLGRHRFARLILLGQRVFLARANAWAAIAQKVGITYVPAPGGAPSGVRWLARQKWAAEHIGPIADLMDAHGGMDEAVAAARESGVFLRNMTILGKDEDRAKLRKQMNDMQSVEDGFEGVRSGVRFSVFEWSEDKDDNPDIYHLVIVLKAPARLQAVTHIRGRHGSWPHDAGDRPLLDVDLGVQAFDRRYDVRASDQVEARAILNPAVIERLIAVPEADEILIAARDNHLVIDLAAKEGYNRFNLIAVPMGSWSDETLRTALGDLAEALSLVDVFAHALMVRA